MKNFIVNVDFVMSRTLEIEAENEQQAIEKINSLISQNPYNYASDFSHYVSHEVIDAEEE